MNILKKTKTRKTKLVGIWINKEEKDRLVKMAQKDGRSLSNFIKREILRIPSKKTFCQ